MSGHLRKRVAAVVMIAGLATLVASWSVREEGEKLRDSSEHPCARLQVEGLLLRLELAPSMERFRALLGEADGGCVATAAQRMLFQGWFLLASYGVLVAALFVMLAGLRVAHPLRRLLWSAGGVLLGVVAAGANALENWWLARLLAGQGDAGLLASVRSAASVKWGVLAAAAAAAAVLWAWRPVRPADAGAQGDAVLLETWLRRAGLLLAWLLALAGLAAAAALGWGLVASQTQWILRGAALLLVTWLGGLGRAMGVAAEPAASVPSGEEDEAEALRPECAPPPGEAPSAVLHARAYPRDLWEKEWRATCERRRQAGLPPAGPRVGFGLSGGGIRSATVNLGVFQGLAAAHQQPKRLLERIDLVSTVSGGGYFGGFLGRLWTRLYVAGPADVAEALRGEGENGRKVLRYLRENGRYLSPNGAGDLLFGGAVVLRNWVSVQLVLLVGLLVVFLALQTARPAMDLAVSRLVAAGALPRGLACYFELAGASFWWSPWLLVPLLAFLLVAFPLGWAYWMVEPARRGRDGRPAPPERPGWSGSWVRARLLAADPRWERSEIAPLAGLLLIIVVGALMALGPWRAWARAAWALVAATGMLTLGGWLLARWAAARRGRRDEGKVARAASRETHSGGVPSAREMERDQALHQPAVVRQLLSVWLTAALVSTAVLAALALLDSLGQSLYVALLGPDPWTGWLAGLFSGLGMLAAYARRIAVVLSKGKGDERPSARLHLFAGVAALALVTFLLACLNAASHAVAWRGGAPEGSLPWRQHETGCVAAATAAEPCSDAELSRRPCAGAGEVNRRERRDAGLTGVALAIALVLSVFFGQTFPFVNRSSHHALYSSRLTRAYLGASNPPRWSESVTRVLPGDDSDLKRYWPPPADKAAPIHLINVTVNETVSGRSQIEQKDRKGNNLALGPYGLSLGVEHHAVIGLGRMDPVGRAVVVHPRDAPGGARQFRVFEYPRRADGAQVFRGEVLSLGNWIGVSGAAFSTGLGARTSLGLSLLAGFGNVRLGRWWDSGVAVAARSGAVAPSGVNAVEQVLARLFPVQVFLFDEFLARFPGTARRHWYLSDGGHFENLGGYELVRRRLPTIVLVDAEEDADSTFGGLSNLVRKARIDFGAEITFLDEKALAAEIDPALRAPSGPLGTLSELGRDKQSGFSRAHAALAWITYADEPERRSRLFYVKATVTGDEPTDVLEYQRAHPAFPHESTGDQFFDEAQWESYRKLGEHIATRLFTRPVAEAAAPPSDRWWPDDLG